MQLQGRRVVVMGGSRGIGRSIALGFAQEGASVALCARGKDALEATRAEVAALGVTAFAAPCDLAKAADIAAFVQERGIPAVVTGDLNADVRSASVRALFDGERLTDARAVADVLLSPQWGTYAHYRRPRVGGRRIDAIAVTPGVQVRAVGANARTFDGVHPSDHLAVQAVIRVGAVDASSARRTTR